VCLAPTHSILREFIDLNFNRKKEEKRVVHRLQNPLQLVLPDELEQRRYVGRIVMLNARLFTNRAKVGVQCSMDAVHAADCPAL
jgi:hypothetical protein